MMKDKLTELIDTLLKYDYVEKDVKIGYYNIDFVINGYIAISILTDEEKNLNEYEKEISLKYTEPMEEYVLFEYDDRKCTELEFMAEIIAELTGVKKQEQNETIGFSDEDMIW